MKTCSTLCLLIVVLLAGCNDEPNVTTTANDHTLADDPHAGVSLEATTEPNVIEPSGDSGGLIELGEITLTAPANWPQMKPSSSFVAAEFSLQRAEGDDDDGRLTISTAGGTVEANIERWKGQFDAQAQQKPQEEIDVVDTKVTIVDLSGDFNDQRGPFAPAVKRSDYRMIAAIVPVESQLHFIKATGPQKTIAAHADDIHKFIRSIERKN